MKATISHILVLVFVTLIASNATALDFPMLNNNAVEEIELPSFDTQDYFYIYKEIKLDNHSVASPLTEASLISFSLVTPTFDLQLQPLYILYEKIVR